MATPINETRASEAGSRPPSGTHFICSEISTLPWSNANKRLSMLRENNGDFMNTAYEHGLKAALMERDGPFGNYSAAPKKSD